MRVKTAWLLLGVLCLASFAAARATQWDSYMDAANEAYLRGRHDEAKKLLLAARKEAEKFGEEDPRLATSLNDLAEVHHKQGNYAEAEPLLRRSLTIRENALGPEHPTSLLD